MAPSARREAAEVRNKGEIRQLFLCGEKDRCAFSEPSIFQSVFCLFIVFFCL